MSENKYAIVTGASQGMGKHIALELAKRHINLVLISLPDQGLDSFCQTLISDFGIEAIAYETDLCITRNIMELTQWINENFEVYILINNAGLGGSMKFTEARTEYISKIIQLNVTATSLLTHLLLPNLIRQKKAYILNISSIAALAPIGYKTVYPASKAFVHSFSRGLRYELKDTNVLVSVAHPGPMKTTVENTERLDRQGALGKFLMSTPERNARVCVEQLLKGRSLIILNRLSWLVMNYAPDWLKTRLISEASKKEILEQYTEHKKAVPRTASLKE
ncbi:SDR family oxidoreductase [Elizabethkingia anophelis]|uniref:SDR family NAD(P)-dependent oxidoreductase n=1 Tax=Elizabethkingia anophelis TaxID=1117645 RepID=UPI0012B28A90|nr:SDR family NAD(P)-dependent oxidoreductase [Elizabethkingia anophelis]QGN23308.1 SDR family NAD(P)-dependent oxidoreductase [Elizabethkingia anophelis]QNV09957.1 SDR family NAD(P)-dependent oxidoreductase [Elizabethkingia anophelis]UTF88097.1 SDR family NAD(P)-dependent oxidoreductase [Elizabethkingia anophelis]UTF98978.1 SDR family NAD(P)-dependent oxidoreductase [Elizabethkingia anophelis]UTG02734.1 SDR family NAD(P)-dependent oxidoreductase [Elizabethkingia anophelis]